MSQFRLSMSLRIALLASLLCGGVTAEDHCPPDSKSASISVRATVISPLGVTVDPDRSSLDIWGDSHSEPQVRRRLISWSHDADCCSVRLANSDSPHIRGRAQLSETASIHAVADSVVVSLIFVDQ